MNSIVENYRKQFPDTLKTDEEVMDLYASGYPQETLAQYPDFVEDWQKLQTQRRVNQSSVLEEAGKGFSRGLTGLESTAAGGLALLSSSLGAQGAKDYWLDVYKRKTGEMAQEEAPSVPRVQDIQGLSSGLQYLSGKAAELVPNVGEALVAGGIGTMVAPGPGTEAGAAAGLFARSAARSALRKLVEKTLSAAERKELEDFALGKIAGDALSKKTAQVVADASKYMASTAAATANFAALGAGGGYGELSGRPGVTEEAAREGALIAGAGASFGALIPAGILKGLFGEKVGEQAARDYVEKWAVKVPKELLTAGSGMGAMEFFNILAEKHADPAKKDEDFTKEDWSRILNAAATGIIAGAPAAGIAAVRGVKPPVTPTPPPKEAAPAPATPAAAVVPPAPETPAQTAARNYPVTGEQKILLRRVAEEVASGKVSSEEEEALLAKNPGFRPLYQTIKAEVANAIEARKVESRVQSERVGDNAQLRKEEEDRNKPPVVEEKGAQAGAGHSVQQAAGEVEETPAQKAAAELTPEKKAALESAGVTPEKLGVPMFVTKEMEQALADLGYTKEQRGKITADEAQKIIAGNIRAPKVEAPPIAEATPKAPEPPPKPPEPLPPETPAAKSEVKPEQAALVTPAVTPAPAPVEAGAGRSTTAWVDRVQNTYNAWHVPLVEANTRRDFFGGLEAEGNNKESTNTLGVFERPDGTIVVATLKQTGKPRVDRVQATASQAKGWDAVIADGWKPVGVIRMAEKQQKFFREYTKDEWAEIQPKLEAKAQKAKEDVGPIPPPITKAEVVEAGLHETGGVTSDTGKGSVTRDDAAKIHDLIIKERGLPEAEDVREMVSDAILTSPDLQARLREIAGAGIEGFARLMNRIFEVYERAADSGETDPAKLRATITRALEGLSGRKTEGGAQSSPPVSGDVLQSRPVPTAREARVENAEIAQHVVARLLQAGVPVNVIHRGASELIAATRGWYDRTTKAVTLALSDISRPANQDLHVLFEEAGHALFDRESPEVRSAVLAAIAGFAERNPAEFEQVRKNIEFAAQGREAPDRFNESEELLMGWMALRLAKEGFNPAQSRGIAATIMQKVKDLYLSAAMWFQQTFLSKDHSNSDLALRYWDNRLRSFLSGDTSMGSWVERIGGPKAPFSTEIAWHQPVSGEDAFIQRFNPVTGQVDTSPLLENSVAAAHLNSYGDQVLNAALPMPGAPPQRMVDPSNKLNREVAANNEVKATQEEAAAEAGVPREQFRAANGLTATDRIAAFKETVAHELNATNFRPDQRLSELANPENVVPAHIDAIRRLTGELGKLGKNKQKDKEHLEKLEKGLPDILRQAEKELDAYKDAQFMGDQIESGFKKMTSDALRRVIQTSRALGTIFQIGNELEERVGQPVSPQFINALRKLHTGSELEGTKLFDLLDFMANDPSIDFTKKVSELKEQIRHQAEITPDLDSYQRLVQNTPESRALLATVIAYGKTHQRILADLEMRRMQSGEDRAALEQKVKDLWKETREQIQTGIKRTAKSAKLEERARGAYRETLARVMQARKTQEHLQARLAMNEKAIPVYQKAIDRLDPKIKRAVETEFQDGMKVRLPKTMEVRPKEFDEVTINLDSTRGPITDLVPIAEKLGAWLKVREEAARNGDETALNIDYQTARQQLLSIFNNRYYQFAVQKIDSTTTGLVLGPATKKVRSIGTPTADALSTLVNKTLSDTQTMRNAADVEFGYRNSHLENKLIGVLNQGNSWWKAKKVSPAWFDKYIKNAAFGFMEKQQFSEGGDHQAELAAAYNRLGQWLLANDSIRPLIQDRMPEFMTALRNYMESVYESGQFWNNKNVEAEMLVKDPKLGDQLRVAFPQGMRTFQRKFSDTYQNMVHALRLSGWELARDDFKNVRQMLQDGNRQGAEAIIQKYFNNSTYGDTVQNDFWYLLTHVPDESTFEAPPFDESGITVPAEPSLVSRAYEEAGGDVIKTFELMHQYHNGVNEPAAYVQDSLMLLADQFQRANSALKKIEPKTATEVSTFVGMIPNAMIDARQFPHWPSEWFDYHKFDRNDNARMAERIAGQLNYGRDTRTLANLHDTLKTETDTLVSKLRVVLGQAERTVPSGKKSEIRAAAAKILDKDNSPALSRFKTGKEKLDYLEKIEERAPFVQDFMRDYTAYYQRGADQNGSLNWGIRFAQAMAGLLVNNPASALSQLATMFDIPVQWGASPTMLKATARVMQLTGKDIAGGLAQGIGWQFMRLSPYEQKYLELRLNDPEVKRRFGDIMAVQEGEQNNPASRFFRIAKEAQSFTLNLRGEKAQYTPIRPLAPFFQTVFNANRALTVGLWELADNYVAKGVKYLQANPGTEKITADNLGLKGLDRDSFERWQADAGRYGFQYTEAVKGAVDRIKNGDKTLLTDDQLGKLYSLGMAEISLETSIATMPMAAFNNKVIRFGLPLLGWSYRRALQVGERLGGLGATDQRNLKAVGTALLGLGVTGLGGLGLSLAVDWYQEDVVGKKRNIRALRFPTTGNDWIAIQERLNRIGTFGLWGELVNSAVNVGTGQGDNRLLSVDQRVVALQSMQGILKAISALVNQDFDPDYRNVVRPMISALGGAGALQYQQIVNHAFDLDNAENRVIRRINAENYLRVTGRDLGMNIRTGGGGYNTPTPITPWLARMEYAAYANNPAEFKEMYQGALDEARKAGKSDPADYVKRAFETRHPLRYVFGTTPSHREYLQVLANMDEKGQVAVTDSIRLFNYYGASLGLTPFEGSVKKDQKKTTNPASRARSMALGF